MEPSKRKSDKVTKKRRMGSSGLPAERRVKYESRGDLMVARDRLKGALLDLIASEDDSSSSVDEGPSGSKSIGLPFLKKPKDVKPCLIRQRKRKSSLDLELAFQHTFVMKLFDRSVDLAQFRESTPLYPICRAWIKNQPLMPQPYQIKDSPEIKNEYEELFELTTEVRDTYRMPPPISVPWGSRIPSIPPPALKGVALDYSSSDKLPTANELLAEHQVRWKNVRQKWIEAARENEQRFQPSGMILTNMYKRSQGL